uniref:G-protein coupled receptors family 1 profile domain-containing protein n=1 Tax=Clytia hemisphaerica TaxID=252671 RepID=A0A7M5X7T2_9CNID
TQVTRMNITTNATCVNLYKRFHLTNGHQTFLVTYSVAIIGVSNCILNGLVVALLFLSKQIQIPSMRLFLISSLSDILLSIIAPVSHTFLFKFYGRESNCTLEIVISSLIGFFGRVSGYMICLIGYDRYARVKYLNEYKTKITPKTINRLVGTALAICVFHRVLVSLGLFYHFHKIATYITIIMDICMVLIIIMFYILAAKTIKDFRRDATNKEIMKSIDKTITKMAKYYLSSIVLFYAIYVVFLTVYIMLYPRSKNKGIKSWLEFMFLFGTMMGLT